MSKNLIIVESPAKAKTIQKYLGKEFEVLASYGHVRDLTPKEGAVDTANDFAMNYQLIEKNQKHVENISKSARRAEALYLATDPDREGEAISWHLYEILREMNVLKNKPVHRVVFHEITQNAIREAIEHPRSLSMELVNAQQARRALDYLVGFNLSPLLWRKIRYGLSAGRVQSPALRMIVEREQEIENFKPQEYWTIEADCQKEKQPFIGRLIIYNHKKVEQFDINNETQATEIKQKLLELANGKLLVTKVERKQRKRSPAPPFTTSTLQQEAARKLGFTTRRTMQIAQNLYEGVDIGSGAVGLITYMRTDSLNLADEAIQLIREEITTRYGADNLPNKPVHYKTKAKNAQEAHEAIRPTDAHRHPDDLVKHLTQEQLKLYTLIWKRTVACQMIHATLDTVAVDLTCGEGNIFRANGSTVTNPGFMMVYQEDNDDQKKDDDEKMLPLLTQGESVKLKTIRADQHFTEPPPRYSEASLVKALEEYGIGRPSTYASIIATLQQREYVTLDKKRFLPTDVGRVVNKLLTEHFKQYVDYDFTARMEDELDAVSRGEKQWIPLMEEFWTKFKNRIDDKMQSLKKSDVTNEVIDESCPKCAKPLTKRLGKRGIFIGCTGYPECDYTRNIGDDTATTPNAAPPAQIVEGRNCPSCGAQLVIKQSRSGSQFIGCSTYPKCTYTESMPADNTGVTCPSCKKGKLIRKKSRFGTFFYACSAYPDCKYAVSAQPIAETCPNCQFPILMVKQLKKGTVKQCPRKECGYKEQVDLLAKNDGDDWTPPERVVNG